MSQGKESPLNRRRSIAVVGGSKPSAYKHKRRTYSMVGGDRLSPLAKARRSLVPRKSILKGSNIQFQDQLPVDIQNSSQQQSQQSSYISEDNGHTMDFTSVINHAVGNDSRKSLGRRVSFAPVSHVRFFSKNQGGSSSAASSPEAPRERPRDDPPPVVNDENAYPGASNKRRRSSNIRYSLATSEADDMDLTGIGPAAFAIHRDGVADDDDDGEFGENDDEMEMTEVLQAQLARRKSVAIGSRQPLAPISTMTDDGEEDLDQSGSYMEEDSTTRSDFEGDRSSIMDVTIPLAQSLKPANQDEVWLALKRMAGGGDTSLDGDEIGDEDNEAYDENNDGLDLEAAKQRLLRARESLSLSQETLDDTDTPLVPQHVAMEASFTSTDDSMMMDDENMGMEGDRTLNMSKIVGRASLGGLMGSRLSVGGMAEISMDESEIYGRIMPTEIPHSSPISPPRPQSEELYSATSRMPIVEALPEIEQPTSNPLKSSIFHPPPKEDGRNSATATIQPAPTVPNHVEGPVFKAPTSTVTTESSAIPVFSPPPAPTGVPNVSAFTFQPPANAPKPPSLIPQPKSPFRSPQKSFKTLHKSPAKTTFSAAFAPPVAKPTPTRSTNGSTASGSTNDSNASASSATARSGTASTFSSNKRSRSEIESADTDRLTPAKRAALSHSAAANVPATVSRAKSPTRTKVFSRPSFSGMGLTSANPTAAGRRASVGYAARRKSIGMGLAASTSGKGPFTPSAATDSMAGGDSGAVIAHETPSGSVESQITLPPPQPSPSKTKRMARQSIAPGSSHQAKLIPISESENPASQLTLTTASPQASQESLPGTQSSATSAGEVVVMLGTPPSSQETTTGQGDLQEPSEQVDMPEDDIDLGMTEEEADMEMTTDFLAKLQDQLPLSQPEHEQFAMSMSSQVQTTAAATNAMRFTSEALAKRRQSLRKPIQQEELEEDAMDIHSATKQWGDQVTHIKIVNTVAGNEDDEEDDIPPISIEQFFSLTGIGFLDDIHAPRRSLHFSTHPFSQQPRKSSDIPLSEYAVAVGNDVPQLILYTNVTRELQNWMEKSKAEFEQAEEEAGKLIPELFAEYMRADEEGKAELKHQLSLIKNYSRGLAIADWYKWKYEWVQGLKATAEDAFNALESDARTLESLKQKADEVLPALRKEYGSILRELEKEQAEIAEIEQCDQGWLQDLKISIVDQAGEIEALQAEVAEDKTTLRHLQDKLNEIEQQKAEASAAIASSQRVLNMQQNGTRAEVNRLKEELQALEDLHLFRITKVVPELFEFVYANQVHISVPCRDLVPFPTKISINKWEQAPVEKDDFPKLSEYWLRTAPKMVATMKLREGETSISMSRIITRLSDYFVSCSQLRTQIQLLGIRYPVTFDFPSPPGDPAGFKVTATVLFTKLKAKALITFLFPTSLFTRWPASIDELDIDVRVVYGALERATIIKAVIDHLATLSPGENYSCLLDACMEAQAQYT